MYVTVIINIIKNFDRMKWFSNLSLFVAIASCCTQKQKMEKAKCYNLTIKYKILDMTTKIW